MEEEEEGRTQMMEEEDGAMEEEEKEEKRRVCIIESHDSGKSRIGATMNRWATSLDDNKQASDVP